MDTNILSDKLKRPLQLDRASDKQLKQFISGLFHQPEKSYATFTIPAASLDPLSYLQANWNNRAFQYYWEKPSDHFALAAGEALVELSASGSDRFADINHRQQSVIDATASFSVTHQPCSGLMFLGGFSFFDQLNTTDWHSFEAASLTLPKWLIAKEGEHTFVTLALDIRPYNSPENLYRAVINQLKEIEKRIVASEGHPVNSNGHDASSPNGLSQLDMGYDAWIASVEKAQQSIRQNVFEKIVLARRLSVPRSRSMKPTELLRQLRHQYQNCSCFLVHPAGGNSFLGATPEQLVAFQHDFLRTEALAGSMERGDTAAEDIDLEKDLSFSAKNRNEHQFVVQDIEQRLAPFAHSIHRSSRPQVKKLSNVQHLYTPIKADLKSEATFLSVLEQLHPTSAVGGYPWKEAAPYIQQLENFERGWYAGPVGWLNASGSGEFAVAIRSGLLTNEQAHFFAGCGIVADSDADAEWKETNLKLKPMLSALPHD